MKYFDKTFWKMTFGFVLIVIIGLISVIVISQFDQF